MNRQCFLCGSEEYTVIHNGVRHNGDIDVLRCRECGLVRLSDFITNTMFYEKARMRQDEEEESIKEIRVSAEADDERRFKYMSDTISNKTMLDFGCGAGGLLIKARKIAKKVYGVELEENMRYIIKKDGIDCFESIDCIPEELKGSIDVITLFHVLEHLENPIEILRHLKSFLSPGGKIIIEVPNADDALLSLYNNKAFADFTYWEAHLFLYTNDTLKKVVEKAGLKPRFVEQIQRYPLSNTLYWLSNNTPGGHKVWSTLSNEYLDDAYGRQLARLGIADTIMLVAM